MKKTSIHFGIVILTAVVFMLAFTGCPGARVDPYGHLPGKTFRAQDMNEEFYDVPARLLAEGTYCDIWVESFLDFTPTQASALAAVYDNGIRPNMLDAFSLGTPLENPMNHAKITTNPIDYADYWGNGDGKLTILILDIKGGNERFYVAGYFYPVDILYTTSQYSNSNGRDMIYLNIRTNPGSAGSNKTLSHELQHLINFAFDLGIRSTYNPGTNVLSIDNMDLWINEGLSSAAEYLYDLNHNMERIAHYNNHSNDGQGNINGLIFAGNNFYVWGESPDYILDEYATVYLFFQWLRLQAKTEAVYKNIGNSSASDFGAVEQAMLGKGNYASDGPISWETLLKDWFAANFLTTTKTPTTISGTYGTTPKHSYMNDPILSQITATVIGSSANFIAGTNTPVKLQLFPGEGVYSRIINTTKPAILGTGSGSHIVYAGIEIDKNGVGSGTVAENNLYTNGFLMTYNKNTDNSVKNYSYNHLLEDSYFFASMVPSSPAFAIQNNNQRSLMPNLSGPHAISLGDMQRMNGYTTGIDYKQLNIVR